MQNGQAKSKGHCFGRGISAGFSWIWLRTCETSVGSLAHGPLGLEGCRETISDACCAKAGVNMWQSLSQGRIPLSFSIMGSEMQGH